MGQPGSAARPVAAVLVGALLSIGLALASTLALPSSDGQPRSAPAVVPVLALAAGSSPAPVPDQLPAVPAVGPAPAAPAAPAGQSDPASTRAGGQPQPLQLTAGSAPAVPKRSVDACDQDVAPGEFACFAVRRIDAGAEPTTNAFTAQTTPGGFGPAQLTAAYRLPSATAGAGQTVYIVDAYDDPKAESDLGVYRAQFGLPACTTGNGCFRKVNQRGTATPPDPSTGWVDETSLDLDMVSAICPLCHITLVEADSASGDMMVAVKRATTMGARFVSMSWGAPEDGNSGYYDRTYLVAKGVVYTAASGDRGYSAGPIYPATSSRVVAAGGTSLYPSGNARGWTESAWSGAGSGCSVDEARPTWQLGATSCSKRGTTDVSAVADPNTGVAVYQSYTGGGWTVFGGTSAAAPIIAATYALAGTPSSSVNPSAVLYRHPKSLFDVTTGSNGSCGTTLCTAAPGWDGPTGLGTPDGVASFQLSSHATRPGHTVLPGWPHSRSAVTGSVNSAH